MSDASGLKTVSTPDLERLLTAVRKGKVPLPLSKTALASVKLGAIVDKIDVLRDLPAAGIAAVIEPVLAERSSEAAVRAPLTRAHA